MNLLAVRILNMIFQYVDGLIPFFLGIAAEVLCDAKDYSIHAGKEVSYLHSVMMY